jgi:hypothetical protein
VFGGFRSWVHRHTFRVACWYWSSFFETRFSTTSRLEFDRATSQVGQQRPESVADSHGKRVPVEHPDEFLLCLGDEWRGAVLAALDPSVFVLVKAVESIEVFVSTPASLDRIGTNATQSYSASYSSRIPVSSETWAAIRLGGSRSARQP